MDRKTDHIRVRTFYFTNSDDADPFLDAISACFIVRLEIIQIISNRLIGKSTESDFGNFVNNVYCAIVLEADRSIYLMG
ncbi:hypothetical protein D3C86_1155850 [compost metagenome]